MNERDTQIVYRDDGLAKAFANGKFILESTGTKIDVKMSNKGYTGDGTITVNESATGIAFNSLGRTLIEWTQTLVGDEVYYRIKVLEPSGMVFNQNPTTVTINLPHSTRSYDFILQNHYSAVDFSFVDPQSTQADVLRIGRLEVQSAASVNIPASERISLDSVEIKSDNTKFTCQSSVAGNVTVTGSHGVQTFNTSIGGKVTIKGSNNQFRGDVAGNVNFESNNGSLTMNDVQQLTVKTVNAGITVKRVANGATMTTERGNLSIGTIANGGLNFTAGTVNTRIATASVSVSDELIGNATVNNYGIGSVNLHRVLGNVIVNSSEVGGGDINVNFQNSETQHSVKINGYDGDIDVSGINGATEIIVRGTEYAAGAANIKAQFNKIVGTNRIEAGAYVSGHEDWGNVEVQIGTDCNNFNLYVYWARSAKSSQRFGYTEDNMTIIPHGEESTSNQSNFIVNGNHGGSGELKIYTPTTVYLY